MARSEFQLNTTRIGVFDALLQARARAGGGFKIVEDHDRNPLSFDDVVRASFALAGRLKRLTRKGETVGVLLPSGVGAAVVFFALQSAGRIPAMLNFTAGALNLKAACKAAGITRILTSEKFIEQGRLEDLVRDLSAAAAITPLEAIKAQIGPLDKIAALIKGLAPKAFRTPVRPTDPAVILFTSGSFGAPRGVALSHQNLVANVEQCAAHIDFQPDWVFFNPLPMFHCFGLTGGALLPILTGHKVFLYPSPLHFKEIPKLIAECGANVLFATDTFAQQYARSARNGELSSLKFAVLGAERVREETRQVYQNKFGVELLEGYGATEASPVLAVNQPGQNRSGTVGRLVPGLEVKLEEVPGIREGLKMIVRGPNIMLGYLSPDRPGEIVPPLDGWHDTGDVVTIDADGYVTIKGRVKRFAKVGGEMVSLAAVESYACAVWPANRHAAVAVPDDRKGERVILITDVPDADTAALIAWAQANGAPEIAVPKKIVKIGELPVLGSGKTDYVAVQKIAEEEISRAAA